MAKRENGAGSWHKRKDGNWEFKVTIINPHNGISIRKSFYGKTKPICRAKKADYEEALKNPIVEVVKEESVRKTLGEWAAEWLEVYKKYTVTPGTYQSYQYDLTTILKHSLCQKYLSEIKKIDIQEFYNDHQKYRGSALKRYRFLLNGAFEEAVENEMCDKNPVRSVKLPKKDKPKPQFYLEEEIKEILDYAKNDVKFGHIMYILLLTGMRSGEVRALMWNDIDYSKQLITINKAIKQDEELGTPKNGTTRYVPAPDRLCNVLKGIKKESLYVSNTPYALPKESFRREYNDFFKRMNEGRKEEIRKLSPHKCRHSYASLLASKNVPQTYIKDMLGHHSLEMTDLYAHANSPGMVASVKAL